MHDVHIYEIRDIRAVTVETVATIESRNDNIYFETEWWCEGALISDMILHRNKWHNVNERRVPAGEKREVDVLRTIASTHIKKMLESGKLAHSGKVFWMKK